MAIDLFDLIPSLLNDIQEPGAAAFPEATDDDWVSRLADAFWETVLDGVLVGYNEEDQVISPVSGTDDLPRELQQLIVIYAGYKVIRNKLIDIKTRFRAHAGAVEYETEQSASLLRAVLEDLTKRRDFIISRLPSIYSGTDVAIFDMASMRLSDWYDPWIGQVEGW